MLDDDKAHTRMRINGVHIAFVNEAEARGDRAVLDYNFIFCVILGLKEKSGGRLTSMYISFSEYFYQRNEFQFFSSPCSGNQTINDKVKDWPQFGFREIQE